MNETTEMTEEKFWIQICRIICATIVAIVALLCAWSCINNRTMANAGYIEAAKPGSTGIIWIKP